MAAECGNAIAADGRGMPWKLQWFDVREIAVEIAVQFRGNCRVLEGCRCNYRGWTQNGVVLRGNCSGLTSVEIAVEFRGNCRVLEDCRGNCRGWPRNAVVFRGNCCGLTSVEIAVAIAVGGLPWELTLIRGLSWYLPRMAAECRGIVWKLLWFDVRRNCRGNSQPVSSVAIAAYCHCICRGRIAVAIAVECGGIRV